MAETRIGKRQAGLEQLTLQDSSYPSDYWRSLYFFNLYRLMLASFFVFLVGTFGTELAIGARDWALFYLVALTYALSGFVTLGLIRLRWPRFVWQLGIQVASDVAGLTVLSYASGGIASSIGMLLLVSLAAAGMISRGKITLFFAALASIAALLEHSYSVLYDGGLVSQYIQVGIMCAGYFAVAWLAHRLAQYAVDSQQLAQRRGRDLLTLSEASSLVMRDMQDGVLVVDADGSVTQLNPAAKQLLHKEIEVGSQLSDAYPVLFGQYVMWRHGSAISRDLVQLDVGVPIRMRFVSAGEMHGTVIFLEDMRRVQAEAQQIKLAALGRLTANIAHEIRNPLSSISYATELMAEEVVDGRQQRMLQIVLDNTRRINQIVQDVMQLNRRDRAQAEVLDLVEVLDLFVGEFVQAERAEAGIIVVEGDVPDQISFDRGHLRQVLWNLCRNALRYCEKRAGSVRLRMSVVGNDCVLDVLDDGCGIAAEQQGKLFEPFFTTASDGTGLGLYIAKELCQANGAELVYQSAAEDFSSGGACFRITFATMTGRR